MTAATLVADQTLLKHAIAFVEELRREKEEFEALNQMQHQLVNLTYRRASLVAKLTDLTLQNQAYKVLEDIVSLFLYSFCLF